MWNREYPPFADGDLPFDSLPGGSGACGFDRHQLELYLEGELEAAGAKRASVHLARCAGCRRYAARYDELTARLLAGGTPRAARGAARDAASLGPCVDKVMERVRALAVNPSARAPEAEDPRGTIEVVREARSAPAHASRTWSRRLRAARRLAAVLVAAAALGLWAVSQFRGQRPGGPGGELQLASPQDRTALLLASHAGDRAGYSQDAGAESSALLWLVEGPGGSLPVARRSRDSLELRLYGVGSSPPAAREPRRGAGGRTLRWIVDAVTPRWRQHRPGSRFFLVLDASDGGIEDRMEFVPVSWFKPLSGDAPAQPLGSTADSGAVRCCRVVVVPRSELISSSLPSLAVHAVDGVLPLSRGETDTPSPWAIPVRLR